MNMVSLKYDENGLVTAVAQDLGSGKVLMVAMMNALALKKTRETQQAYFWSRSRKKLWLKGETSGNILEVNEIRVDCDGDALLLLVTPRGPACHTGNNSCFFRELESI
jgi:phosphoribosyl-AMP cyclohydrolase